MTGDEAIKVLLAEAERRGAERGWDEGEAHMAEVAGWWVGPDAPSANPYRKPSIAVLPAQEPVRQPGIRVRPYRDPLD